ncbi:MAG: alpha-glucan family phosphorylase [Candidatus Scalindua rubra]|uniref:Glycogen phosphorylase n=1 Tax=Candidatus Scalindua brodae TaxID=237368 RepID=A0A0B0EJ44_9BACT|nr:MAG: glycogen phosphorylase [Candidatus Scalindua brodae]MBZ0107797.1 alpha-glucan family phosphorylase [Candidatus Scalindua rubra]
MDSMKDKFPKIPERITGLGELAYNLWWSWNPAARMLFKSLDRQAWKESVHNPVRMLREIPVEILESAVNNPQYLKYYDETMSEFNRYMEVNSCWFTENITSSVCLPVAYFSAEYGLHHSLPFYAGGLGFLAGDHIKECSDLGIPLIAIGFMYPEGYFRQKIRVDGWQETVNETLNRDVTPITKVLNKNGEQLVVKVPFTEPPIHVVLWKVDVGRVKLYLMDTDIEINAPWHRTISSQLYVGDIEHRLLQELVLGIGGSEVLREVGIHDYILHLNEGHTSFALIERVRTRMASGMSYDDAVRFVRNTSIFTTHTPVPAGIDVFPFYLMDKYFSGYYSISGLNRDSFFRLGTHPENPSAGFNMAVLALNLTAYHNGVSKKHGEVARQMWQSVWPDKKVHDVPIDYITNGVHVPTWLEPKMEILFNRYLGPDWKQHHDSPDAWRAVDDIPNRELWQVYMWTKTKLVNAVRELARKKWVEEKADPLNVISGGTLLDPLALTIGFARRFATYKRAYLIFSSLERLKRLLNNRWRPVQIIFAGKAHPADDEGKRVLQKVFNNVCDPAMGGHIAFIENYDEQLAQYLVHGVDVWLNNPVPPLEASGTSGMKAAINGVPTLSILDGWWLEGYNGKNGWAFEGCGSDIGDAESIYRLLENNIIPLYYNQDQDGVPQEWVRIMKESIKSTGAAFSARRMVKEYALRFYQHALKADLTWI